MRLEAELLVARHGLLEAVRQVSFAVETGETLALVGANGAGKTTLLRTLCGVHPAAGGAVRLAGRDIVALPAHLRLRAGLAMAPEGRRLFPDMSVRENLAVAAENGRRGRWSVAAAFEAFPQLAERRHVAAKHLSGGQRQAVAIARALVANPQALLLDEVSLGLSPAAIDGLYRNLAAIKAARDTALIIVEQDLGRALSFADRLICMLEGRIVLAGSCRELARERVEAAYFGLGEAA